MKVVKKGILYISLLILTMYMLFRVTYTLTLDYGVVAFIISIVIFVIEIYDYLNYFMYSLEIKEYIDGKIDEGVFTKYSNDEYPDVDILIATYNESEEIIFNTVKAVKNLDYPDKKKVHIYLCDDGNRKNIKKLAISQNIKYISRKNNRNYKAGNYNNALKSCTSEYVVTFDSDMRPNSDFLKKVMPLFENDKLGFVQTPQNFENPDIFSYRLYLEKYLPMEQSFFYNVIQKVKSRKNSVICCGTNVVYRKKALEKAGGFATKSVTEDIVTGMLIQNSGYETKYVVDALSYGVSVIDFEGFIKQRIRWARGMIQLVKNYGIFKNKGLSVKQKFEYMSCVSYWLFCFKRIFFLILPAILSIFRICVINTSHLLLFYSIFIFSNFIKMFSIKFTSDSKMSILWNKVYETIISPFIVVSVFKEIIGKNKEGFEVSPKYDNSGFSIRLYTLITHILFLCLNIVGIFFSCVYMIYSKDLYMFLLPVILQLINIFELLIAILFDLSKRRERVNNYKSNEITKYSFLSIFKVWGNIWKNMKKD